MGQTSTKGASSQGMTTPVVVQLALTGVMVALVFVVTFLPFLRIPLPGIPGGYFNFGDIVIFTSALTFGPVVGGIGGGVGSALADVGAGSAFAPFTLVIKGAEGLVAGYVARRGFPRSDIVAWLCGGLILVIGYFVTVAFLYGLAVALVSELPADIAQALSGGIVGLPVSRKLRASIPPIFVRGRITAPKPPGPN